MAGKNQVELSARVGKGDGVASWKPSPRRVPSLTEVTGQGWTVFRSGDVWTACKDGHDPVSASSLDELLEKMA